MTGGAQPTRNNEALDSLPAPPFPCSVQHGLANAVLCVEIDTGRSREKLRPRVYCRERCQRRTVCSEPDITSVREPRSLSRQCGRCRWRH